MSTNHRGVQLFHENLEESMPSRDDLLQRCIQMDLSGQQGNRELVNKAKMGVSRPIQVGKFACFIVYRVNLSCIKAHQKIFFH